jgi:hypothetical protein
MLLSSLDLLSGNVRGGFLPVTAMARAYEYLVLDTIPEIDALPGDVLVWQFPVVALVRLVHNHPKLSLVQMHPNHWWFILSKYSDRLTPFDSAAPPVEALPGIALGDRTPPPAAPPAPPHRRHLWPVD